MRRGGSRTTAVSSDQSMHHALIPLSLVLPLPMQTYFAHHPVLHAVVDLSGYDGEAAFDLGNQLLSYRVGWLIYVSSDSVYEACAAKNHTGPTREEDAVRDEDLLSKLEAAEEGEDENLDVFGHNKLAAEEQFRDLREETKEDPNGWGYVALRLPDVVGPRDTSYRWWFYQILIRVGSHKAQCPSFSNILV